jgi:CubicO group peptidase (beta-lactamase class C family)
MLWNLLGSYFTLVVFFALYAIGVIAILFFLRKQSGKSRLIFLILSLAALVLFFSQGDRFTYGRLILWGLPNYSHADILPQVVLPRSKNPVMLEKAASADLDDERLFIFKNKKLKIRRKDLDRFLAKNETRSLIIVKDGKIIYENYFNGMRRDEMARCFSITKSVLSILVGIAREDGHIKSVQDPVAFYIPTYQKPDFNNIRIEHLLTMTSGLYYRQHSSLNPFTEQVELYYTPDRIEFLKKATIERAPGTFWNYNDTAVNLLGRVLEKATAKKGYRYLSEKLWEPLGMEYEASWSVDHLNPQNRFAAYASGLNIVPRDLIKIGLLYMNKGKWHGKRIVSEEWVRRSTTLTKGDNPLLFGADPRWGPYWNSSYKYLWWIPREHGHDNVFVANGILGQYLYVSPNHGVVIVRTGNGWGDFGPWLELLGNLARIARGEKIITGTE